MKKCATCKHGEFRDRTPSGRVRAAAGKCNWTEPALIVPEVVRVRFDRTATWPNWGTECPTWEQKENG